MGARQKEEVAEEADDCLLGEDLPFPTAFILSGILNPPASTTPYFEGGKTIGSGACDAGQGRLCFAAISPMTRSHRSFPKLL